MKPHPTPDIYLASASPRRRELLDQIGIRHQQVPAPVDETPRPGEVPAEYVIRLALAKAESGRQALQGRPLRPVLAADTAVVLDGVILGKPGDRDEALAMLQRLSGRRHRVLTGVALIGQRRHSRLSVSQVTFRSIGRQEAEAYWASGEPADKAGGYAIQGKGALFVVRLEGSYSGVMGLPLLETGELLARSGIDPLDPSDPNQQEEVQEPES